MKEKIHWPFRLECTLPAPASGFISRGLVLPELTATWQKFSSVHSFYIDLPAVNSENGQMKHVSEPVV